MNRFYPFESVIVKIFAASLIGLDTLIVTFVSPPERERRQEFTTTVATPKIVRNRLIYTNIDVK